MIRKELDVVVARYNENVDWVHGLPVHSNLFLYNKGTDLLGVAQPLPNMGRETHTYLHHILSVYNKLPNYESDYIAFLQGNPFDHCKDVLEQLDAKIYAGQNFTPLGGWRPTCNLDGTPHHAGLPIKTFVEQVVQIDVPEQLTFTAGAQFVIHKRVIQEYPIEFYWKLLVNSVGAPEVPYIMERLWEQIFK